MESTNSQLQNMECSNILNQNQDEGIVVVSQENEMIDVNSYYEYDETDSDHDDDTTDLEDVLNDLMEVLPPRNDKVSYKILSKPEIKQRQELDIINVSNDLSIPKNEAIALLLYCKWDVDSVAERWARNAQEFRDEVGIFEKATSKHESETQITCEKCSGTVPDYLASVTFCGHKYCKTCWQDFIRVALSDPHFSLSCPYELCDGAVSHDLITLVGLESEQKIYAKIFLRSYLSNYRKGRWCPNVECDHGVVLDSGSLISRYTCKCLYSFCYKCEKEDHHPVRCGIAEKWQTESLEYSQNWDYCPRCAHAVRSPEFIGWFMRVECDVCRFDFCRICNWSYLENGIWEGDLFTHICRAEKYQMDAGVANKSENARNAMIRFLNYLAHWNNRHHEHHQVLTKLREMQNKEMVFLAERQGLPLEEVSFVKEAWLQAAECKRFFKWATVYDYFILVSEENKRPFYNSLSDNGAFVLEELSKVAGDLNQFVFGTNPPTIQFEDFRERLSFKSRVARNYFESMEIVIHNGYPDMEALRYAIRLRQKSTVPTAENNVETSRGQTEESAAETSNWTCPHCRFCNYDSTTICFMCQMKGI